MTELSFLRELSL